MKGTVRRQVGALFKAAQAPLKEPHGQRGGSQSGSDQKGYLRAETRLHEARPARLLAVWGPGDFPAWV